MLVHFRERWYRYTSCGSKHPEEFLVGDPVLREALRSGSATDTMMCFMRFQPCHYSTGRHDGLSCSNLLLELNADLLRPRGIQMVIKLTGIHVANWKFAVADEDRRKVHNAQEGMLRLMKSGIELSSMTTDDWERLAKLCLEPVNVWVEDRLRMDDGIKSFLQELGQM
jgi:hypothetical protein